jgi:hypothetical protein
MQPVVTSCAGCGVRLGLKRPEVAVGRGCPRCGYSLEVSLGLAVRSPGAEGESQGRVAPDRISPNEIRWPSQRWVFALLALSCLIAVGLRWPTGPEGRETATRAVGRPFRPAATVSIGGPRAGEADAEADADARGDARPEVEDGEEPQAAQEAGVAGPQEPEPDPAEAPVPAANASPEQAPTTDVAPAASAPPEGAGSAPRRVRVQSESGRVVVARIHGMHDGEVSVMLPDGQLGLPRALYYTDDAFRPETADAMSQELLEGAFAGFQLRRSAHYLVYYRSTNTFADASVRLLEELFRGLSEAFRKRDIPFHEPEFPLVAVIFRTEAEFRAHKPVDPDVQAYYEIFTNRIYFYQQSERDERSPEVAALRKPQTVAHEGTHQILQNVGVQPRLSAWPLWLVEGMAEYCAAPVTTKKGVGWRGLGVVNPLHMATIRDLEDPLSLQVMGNDHLRIGRDPRKSLIEYLVTRTELTPTDYALAWALTHFLALKRGPEFVEFLKTMSQMPPMQKVTPAEHLAAFRAAFGDDLARMDRKLVDYLSKLKGYEPLPYYAVVFEQRVGGGIVKHAAIVSQSPSMIRQWIDAVSNAHGAPPTWEAFPHPTRARALLTAEQWMRTH